VIECAGEKSTKWICDTPVETYDGGRRENKWESAYPFQI